MDSKPAASTGSCFTLLLGAGHRGKVLALLAFSGIVSTSFIFFPPTNTLSEISRTDVVSETLKPTSVFPNSPKLDLGPDSLPPDPIARPSIHLGGLPGHQVFENVWVHEGTIYLFNPDRSRIPAKGRVVSGQTGWEVLNRPMEGLVDRARNASVLDGTTLFVNDGAKTDEWHYLSSYYHLASEIVLGGIASLASVASLPHPVSTSDPALPASLGVEARPGVAVPGVPDRIVIPWKAAEGWRDREGWGEMTLRGVFGNGIIEPYIWSDLSREDTPHGGWVYMRRAVIIDRWASHRHNSLSESLNKMAASIFSLPHPPFFFTPARSSMLDFFGANIPRHRLGPSKCLYDIPNILYIDRQGTDRKLSSDAHAGLAVVLGELESMGKAKVVHRKMERISHEEQIRNVADVDILIGVHGDGLTHQLWMSEGGVVIELFPPETFLPEYQIIADVLHHEYIPVWNDVALSREEWDALPRQHGSSALYDGREVPLDPVFMRLLLEEVVQRMSASVL
ncbi:hypothetical protein IAR55_002452 [Kwoniella newhampshirensis]|uniref:Glycosyltransferase 61 catalytic domain-containing protein n=1 Tax=Kwoniella newhampshirensis TaxID=1651941 RepID=A0AAW0YTI8_9TREE